MLPFKPAEFLGTRALCDRFCTVFVSDTPLPAHLVSAP
jgi:hypothetical protein